MERSIFPAESVYGQLKNDFVLVAQYTDHQTDPVPALNLEKYAGTGFAVPLYVVTDSKGVEIARLTPPSNISTLTTGEFADFLRDAKRKYAERG